MKITVFGGAKPQPGDAAYNEAYHLGRLLGACGQTVITGGYCGTMEAVSRGAAEAGAHVIGVTCTEIERYRPMSANPWVREVRHFESLDGRLNELMDACQAAVALPGGVGTLGEIVLMWNRVIIHAIPPKPIILVGNGWKGVFGEVFESQSSYIYPADAGLLSFAENVEAAVRQLAKELNFTLPTTDRA